jgi:hypothetical protein
MVLLRHILSLMKKMLPVPKKETRVKIPLKFAKVLDLDKSHLVRVNQGKRNLSIDSAARTVDLFLADDHPVTIFDVLPSLNKFKRYFCQG